MTFEKSRRIALVFATLAISATTLAAPAAFAASPVHARQVVESAAQDHLAGPAWMRHASIPQPQSRAQDPFADMLLG
jgi:hypothetical protein